MSNTAKINEMKQILSEKSISRCHDGWRKPIECNGPPGLTSREQDTNRKGGMLVGKTATEALQCCVDWAAEWLYQFEDSPLDELCDEVIWERDWLKRARQILERKD